MEVKLQSLCKHTTTLMDTAQTLLDNEIRAETLGNTIDNLESRFKEATKKDETITNMNINLSKY